MRELSAPRVSALPVSIKRFISLWGPVIIMMAALHFSSSISDPISLPGVSDKSMHSVSFAVLALLALRALAGGTWRGVTRWTLLGCCLIAVLYGVKDEWQQSYTPGRVPDVMDLVADLTGAVSAAIGAGAWSIIRRL